MSRRSIVLQPQILQLYWHGWSCRQIARALRVSHLLVARVVHRGTGTPTAPPTVPAAPPPGSGVGAREEGHA